MKSFSRRDALKTMGLAGASLVAPKLPSLQNETTHILSLSFDDGFKKSFLRTAEIYEKHGLSACFNVLASAHMDEFEEPDDFMKKNLLGDFELWNELKSRGHEIMPHGWKHENLSKVPLQEAKDLINKCLDYFDKHLDGFVREEAIFNFPFNASNEPLNEWLATQVRAYRVLGTGLNPMPSKDLQHLTCSMGGFRDMSTNLPKEVDEFLAGEGGWFIFNLHGLDKEGWEPVKEEVLDNVLTKVHELETLEILPVGVAISKTR